MNPNKIPLSINYLVFALVLLCSSCGIYTPSTVHTPLFTEKGQVSASVNGVFTGDIQAGYAFGKYWAALGNISVSKVGGNKRLEFEGNLDGRSTANELAIGYFTPKKNKGNFSIYGGYGRGISRNNLHFYPKSSDAYNVIIKKYDINYNKYFVQPGYGWVGKNVEFSLNARIALLQYKGLQTDADTLVKGTHFEAINNSIYPIVEPSATLRLGTKYVKLQAQATISTDLLMQRELNIENTGANFSVGIFTKFPLGKKIKTN